MSAKLRLVRALPADERTPTGRRRSPRPITSYYFVRGKRRPTRVSHSTGLPAALAAIVKRVSNGETIHAVEVCDQNDRLLRTVVVNRGGIRID